MEQFLEYVTEPAEYSVELGRLQQLMSRTGSFPLWVARDLLREYADRDSVVFDPFCGKGTTLLAARQQHYAAYGMDVAPEAVICSSAKLQPVTLAEVVAYIRALPATRSNAKNISNDVKLFFHHRTLGQILTIRDRLRSDLGKAGSSAACAQVTLALLLGILHGHASYSLSVSSAHAYSMAPAYVARYTASHELTPPERDVRKALETKANRTIPEARYPAHGAVRRGSVLDCASIFPELLRNVDIVLTSPPYLNKQTYSKDNWLRLWLLGHDYRALRPTYIETGSIARYIAAMHTAFLAIARLMRPGAHLICIAGDVRGTRRPHQGARPVIKTAELLAGVVTASGAFTVSGNSIQVVRGNVRYLHALSGTAGHQKRDLIERVFIAERTGA